MILPWLNGAFKHKLSFIKKDENNETGKLFYKAFSSVVVWGHPIPSCMVVLHLQFNCKFFF